MICRFTIMRYVLIDISSTSKCVVRGVGNTRSMKKFVPRWYERDEEDLYLNEMCSVQ